VNAISRRVRAWLDVPSEDPDNARRRKLLNIILVGFIILGLVLIITLLIYLRITYKNNEWPADEKLLFWSTAGLLIISTLLFIANRYIRGWSPSAAFIFLLIIGISVSDQPEQLVSGRSLLLFTIPIFLASVLMPAWAAFIAAFLDIAILSFLEIQHGRVTSNFSPFLSCSAIYRPAGLAFRARRRNNPARSTQAQH